MGGGFVSPLACPRAQIQIMGEASVLAAAEMQVLIVDEASVYAGGGLRAEARIMDDAFVCDVGLARVQANIVG